MLEEFNKKLVENYIELAKKSSNVILANLVHGFSENEDTLKKLKSEIAYSFSDMPFSTQWENFESQFSDEIKTIKIDKILAENYATIDLETSVISYSMRQSIYKQSDSMFENMSSIRFSHHNNANIDFDDGVVSMDFDISYGDNEEIEESLINTFEQMSEKLIKVKNVDKQFSTVRTIAFLMHDALKINTHLAIECIQEGEFFIPEIIKQLEKFKIREQETQDIYLLSGDKKHDNNKLFQRLIDNLSNLKLETEHKLTLKP